MRPRNSDGTWAMDPFIPTRYGRHSQFYCEGNAWTYSWLVPHDVQGLINLMGGHKSFITKLDSVFAGENFTEAHYRHGNEPDMHYPYLYNYAGVPWKTQYFVRRIMDELYGADPETGLPGDDDVGTMSGWYVFSALGFYPIAPGSPVYTIGSPIFDKVEITLDEKYYDSKKIIIETKNNIRRNIYIQDAMLNGAPLPKSWLTHQELTDNGHLIFNMGPKSNKTWGRKAKNLPPSMTKEKPNFVYSNLRAPNTAKPDEYINVEVTVTNTGGLGTADTKLILFNPHRLVTKGMLVGHKKTVLAKGESLTLKFSVPLYRYRTHTLQVENLTTEVTVPVPKSIREGM